MSSLIERFCALTEKQLDELREKARLEKKDFYTLVVTELTGRRDVTAEERGEIKRLLFGYAYGLTGEKLRQVVSITGRLPSAPVLQNIPLRTEIGKKITRALRGKT